MLHENMVPLHPMRRFVLDIRNNGGGLFPAGVEVARQWLESGDIVLIADSQGVRDSYEAAGRALDAGSPLSVLVNRGTASASEAHCPPSVQGSGFWGLGVELILFSTLNHDYVEQP